MSTKKKTPAKTAVAVKKEASEPKSVTMELTREELHFLHILCSIRISEEAYLTQYLGACLKIHKQESSFVTKVVAACKQANVPHGKSAPDFILVPAGLVPLAIQQYTQDENDHD